MANVLSFVLVALMAWSLAATDALAEGRWQQVENTANCAVWSSSPSANDTVTWSGDCENGKADGYGKEVWRYLADGEWKEDSYTGTMRHGKRTGRGVLVGADGGRYEGDYRDGKEHGRGVYVGANGNRYEGGWKDGKTHGRGVYGWANGDRYEGDFKDGKKHGRGVYLFVDGNSCRGDFREGRLWGRGEWWNVRWDAFEDDGICYMVGDKYHFE